MKISDNLTVWVILASATLTVMAGAVIAPVLNLIRDGVGADPASIGLIITTHALIIALFSPIAGSIIDRKGTKNPFAIGLFVYGISGGMGIFIESLIPLLISRVFLGIGTSLIFVAITTMILNLYEGKERNKIMGFRSSANTFGGIIWPLIGGILGMISWHFPFALYLLGIPMGILVLFMIPETHNKIINKKLKVFHVFKENPVLLSIYGLMFFGMVFLYSIVIFIPQKLEIMGITNTFQISIFITAMAFSAAVVSLAYGKIKSLISYKTIVLSSLLLWSFGFVVLSQTQNEIVMIVSVMLFGAGQGLIMPALLVWIGELVYATLRGRFVSYTGTSVFLGQFLSPILLSPIIIFFGIDAVFLSIGAASAVLFLLFLFGMKKGIK